MAAIEMGEERGRSVNRELNMIPFIDLLMVTIAFLLITAVWVTFSRINANAQIPGAGVDPPTNVEKILHLHTQEDGYALVWKHGATTISESRVAKTERDSAVSDHAKLAEHIAAEWKQHGQHQDPHDVQPDQCVLHSDNRMPFSELVKAIDAVYDAQRAVVLPNGTERSMPVFNVSFSAR